MERNPSPSGRQPASRTSFFPHVKTASRGLFRPPILKYQPLFRSPETTFWRLHWLTLQICFTRSPAQVSWRIIILYLQYRSLWSANLPLFSSRLSVFSISPPFSSVNIFSDLQRCSIRSLYIPTSIVPNRHPAYIVMPVTSLFLPKTSPIYSTSHLPHFSWYLVRLHPQPTFSPLLFRRFFHWFQSAHHYILPSFFLTSSVVPLACSTSQRLSSRIVIHPTSLSLSPPFSFWVSSQSTPPRILLTCHHIGQLFLPVGPFRFFFRHLFQIFSTALKLSLSSFFPTCTVMVYTHLTFRF